MNVLPTGGVRVDDNDQDARLFLLQAGLHYALLLLACLLPCPVRWEGRRGGGGEGDYRVSMSSLL